MSITGHHSSTAVRAYKKVFHHQQEESSLMLQSSDAKNRKFQTKETKHQTQ